MPSENKLIEFMQLRIRDKGTRETIFDLCYDAEGRRLVVSEYHSPGQYEGGKGYSGGTTPLSEYLSQYPEDKGKIIEFFDDLVKNS